MDAIAKFAYPLAAIALAFGLSACGDDITEINANVGAVKSSDDLPACTEGIVGQTAYIKETHEFLGCDGKEWQALSANTVNVGDNVCTSTSLSDGTGFEIFCNGESIGTVKNGKDGADGKDGAKGDPGEAGKDGAPGAKGEKGDDGAPGTNGTNGKDGAPGTDGKDGANGTGCVIKESTALTATIACGSETFTMDLTGYVDVPEECDPTDSACTVPEGEVQLGGVSQKGPFVSGTDVTAYELENGKSLKQTGKTFGGKIENKDGSFNIRTVKLRSTYTYLVADGFYRNEVTGKNSAATIKLRALTNLDGRRTANINLVTHLEYDRVQRLVTKENMSVPAAKRAAEREIFTAFGIDGDGFKGYAEDFNILKEGEGNGELLAISAMLQGDRNESELTALLAALSVDLGDNGKWDDSLRRAQVADWAMKADLDGRLATIRANVEGWKLADSKAPAFEQHVTNFWMQELGVPACTGDNEGALFATKNAKSAYYAANDSVYTDGDSSLVRLICAASGDSYAWRFATDLEKDVAALSADLLANAAANGKINTNFVYVKENGDWRRGTELDASLDAACVADNKGMTDSLIVEREPVWYTCDVNDDASALPSIPTAWRKATTAEADTALFGTPGEGDAIVKLGNVNKSHIYVFEDADGDGNGKWRYGTALDIDEKLGPCTDDKVGEVAQSSKNKWFKCVNDGSSLVEGAPVPTEWREATDFEVDTYSLSATVVVGTYSAGPENSNLYYVKESYGWRPATDLEKDSLKACTSEQQNIVKQSSVKTKENWYKCTNENPVTIDTFKVAYTWRKATDIEKDTVGWGLNYTNGAVKKGKVNSNLIYVYQDSTWRHGTTLDYIFKQAGYRACTTKNDTLINYKYNNLYYVCSAQTTGDTALKWVPAPDIFNDTYDARTECKEGGLYGHGEILVGRVNTEKMYVCDGGVFRPAKSDEISYNQACVSFIDNQIYKLNGLFRRCWSGYGWERVVDKEESVMKAYGKEYKTVVIGTQQWMTENLNYSTSGSYCYNDIASYCNTYGRLYEWSTAVRVCPAGWHLPTRAEWRILFDAVGGEDYAGYLLKSASGWNNNGSSSGNGSGTYPFSVKPAGDRNLTSSGPAYSGIGTKAKFWTSTKDYENNMFYVEFSYNENNVYEDAVFSGFDFSVRCVQD